MVEEKNAQIWGLSVSSMENYYWTVLSPIVSQHINNLKRYVERYV